MLRPGIIDDCARRCGHNRSSHLAKPIAIKPEEAFARSYVDRLILEKLTEMEAAVKLGELADKLSPEGIGLAAVRSLMASNPDVFAYHERRWIPTSRINSQGRPFTEVVRLILQSFGAPMQLALLLDEVARARKTTVEEIELTILRLLDTDRSFVELDGESVALTNWGFVATDEKLARALDLNGVSQEEFDEAKAKLANVDFRSETWAVDTLAHAPIRLKAIGAVAFSVLSPDDPKSILMYDGREVFRALFSVPGFVYAPDGTFHPEAEAKKWIFAALKVADKLASSVELDDAAPIEIKPQDSDPFE